MENNELFKIFNESKSLSEVLKKLNITDNSINWKKIKEIAIDINFDIDVYKKRKEKFCLKCGKKLQKWQKKFCSNSCSASYTNIGRKFSDETKKRISNTILNKHHNVTTTVINKNRKLFCLYCGKELHKWQKKFCDNKCHGKYTHNEKYNNFLSNESDFNEGNYTPKHFKDFFLNEQNGVCAICGTLPEWNNKPLIFILDHIDGDASNNKRSNLRLICPNCDSQTTTFKSKTKNSKRRNYFREKIKNDLINEMAGNPTATANLTN